MAPNPDADREPDPADRFDLETPTTAKIPHASAGFLNHAVALVLFAVAAYFTLWFLLTNSGLWRVFPSLGKPFAWGGGESFDWIAFGWTAGAIALFLLIGWFLLEALEVYLPFEAALALAFVVGMGMAGFGFELLAMAGHLSRAPIFVSLGLMILLLWPTAVWASRRRPESGEGGEGGAVQQTMRRTMAREAYDKSLIRPATVSQKTFRVLSTSLIALISILVFYHAVLYPETYWDSLILYLGYARMMFAEEAIVEKVVGQVGIGLGANYPHLYSLLGAATSVVMEEWSDLPQRTIAPLAGLASTVLVYHTVLRLTRHVNFALAMTLLYRSIPMAIAWDQYASDYALAVLFAAAFLYVALLYVETALSGYFILATFLIALSLHVNYLMGILFLPWAGMLIAAHVRAPSPEAEADAASEGGVDSRSPAIDGWGERMEREPPWTFIERRLGLFKFVGSRVFVVTCSMAALVGSTWFVRNQIVTGNPVYAFFHEFLGGININDAVMDSAAKEWRSNGAGIGRLTDQLGLADEFGAKLRASWIYFVGGAAGGPQGHDIVWRQAYRWQPHFTGFVLGGVVVLIARLLASPFSGRAAGGASRRPVDFPARFGLLVLALAVGLLAFHFLLAPFYLYQIIIILPTFAVLAAFVFPYWRLPVWRGVFGFLVLVVGVVPGLAMGLMGFKIFGPVEIGPGRTETPLDLVVFRHPLPEVDRFYRWRYGPDPVMWRYVNLNLKNEPILTHENRHLVFHPSIDLIHLDDWAIQDMWKAEPTRQISDLKKLGVRYYLKVPNEDRHPINKSLRTDRWIEQGLVELEYQAGGNLLYRLK